LDSANNTAAQKIHVVWFHSQDRRNIKMKNQKYRYATSNREKSIKQFLDSRKGKVLFSLLCVVLILVGSVLTVGGYFLSKIGYTPLSDFELASSIPPEEKDAGTEGITNPDAMQFASGDLKSDPNIKNILLIGSDTRGGEKYGRSDSMMLLSINSKTNQIKLVSFLRDMYVKINGMRDTRINASYAYGGPKLLIDTIQNNFRVKIDNYVTIDFQSFAKAVDILGGVSINLTKAEADELNKNAWMYFVAGSPQKVSAGVNHLNGNGALAYARIRYIDSDFGRTGRQRKIISTIMSSMKHSNPAQLMGIADSVLPLVKTDLDDSQIVALATQASAILNNDTQQLAIPVKGAYKSEKIRGMDVLVPDIEKNKAALWKFLYNIE
jgi:polyisoprenyl-teichoic acid--peptidoglycan teichoic acid transferase